MKTLKGIPASPGIAIGSAYLYYDDDEPLIPRYSIPDNEINIEWIRFTVALDKSKEEVSSLRDSAVREMGAEHGAIFESHLMLLEDEEVHKEIKKSLEETKLNIEWVIHLYEKKVVSKLESIADASLQERAVDIHDVIKRILNHLMMKERPSLANIDTDVVLVSRNLLPSDMIMMNRNRVKAIVLDAGGKTSHVAILARAFEIPAVLGLGGVTRSIKSGATLAVDGLMGEVRVDPDKRILDRFERMHIRLAELDESLKEIKSLPAQTKDGKEVLLKANIEVPEETRSALHYGASGVGLFRSEFLFFQPGRIPSEETQFEAYKKVLTAMTDKPVTIRTLDIGGDKIVAELAKEEEKNPLLGWRAIRYCLSDEVLFQNQLRAILRASAFGDARIMFPMISGSVELDEALLALEKAKNELRKRGQAFREDIPVGIMIEVPSAAMIADILAPKVDFFSIGTNDLIQYTIAADRGNERVAYLHEPFHPAILRIVRNVINAGHDANITVSMCGEMASDPFAAVILLGLGLDEFSMSSVSIPEVKKIIRSVDYREAASLAKDVLQFKSQLETEAYLAEKLSDKIDTGD